MLFTSLYNYLDWVWCTVYQSIIDNVYYVCLAYQRKWWTLNLNCVSICRIAVKCWTGYKDSCKWCTLWQSMWTSCGHQYVHYVQNVI